MKTYCINGTWCRYFIAGDVYVSKDGTVAGKPAYKGKGCKPLSIIEDEGKKYIQVSKNNLVPVDLAVMICYCPPKPNDGKRYTINHKDGDLLNCAASNLEWVIQPYVHTAEDSFDIQRYDITVFKDGHVEQDGKTMTVYDSMFVGDLDLEVCIHPHINVPKPRSIYYQRIFIDDLMNRAGYVQGDDSVFKFPTILHIDYDMTNCAADNLLWVEYDDPRLNEYQSRIKEHKHKRNVELNPGKELPSNM